MAATDLFLIKQISQEDGIIRAQLGVNADNEILKGHFPGHPVVPGASMLQLVKDVLEKALAIKLRLKKADHLKFMSLIEPSTSEVELEISYTIKENGDFFVISKLSVGDIICFKLQGLFITL